MRVHRPMLSLAVLLLGALSSCGDDDSPADPDGSHNPPPTGDTVFDHRAVEDFASLTTADCAAIRAAHHIYYGHTSHGSQVVTGMQMLANEDGRYALPSFHEVGSDLGTGGDVAWAATTRAYLDAHPGEIDVVMWSWCGGVSSNSAEGIDAYLAAMAALEDDYPDVTFVYMTGHLDGSGPAGNLWARNEQIRTWCRAHDKVLFDFAAIESYDPDGALHADGSDACEWCASWCAQHDCPDCGDCAHSHCYNCYRKGMAFWVLLDAITGTSS